MNTLTKSSLIINAPILIPSGEFAKSRSNGLPLLYLCERRNATHQSVHLALREKVEYERRSYFHLSGLERRFFLLIGYRFYHPWEVALP